MTQPVTDVTDIPPSPLATIYADAAGSIPLTQPVVSDGNGNFFFYAATGTYTLVYTDPYNRIPNTVFPDQQVVSPGGGSVTNVAMKGDGVLFTTAITGSPISGTGTLDLSLSEVNFSANYFPAGPASGPAAPLAARKLVTADLPSGVGTVTSVQLGVSVSALFTASVTGTNPIISSGTFTLNLALANQSANTFLAGPASGSAGPVSARTQVAADIAGVTAVSFSVTPTFDASTFAQPTFAITLTGNVTSSTVSNPTNGETITFVITQDGTGGHSFAWPTDFHGASNVETTANSVSVQSFVRVGGFWRATSAGSVNAS